MYNLFLSISIHDTKKKNLDIGLWVGVINDNVMLQQKL